MSKRASNQTETIKATKQTGRVRAGGALLQTYGSARWRAPRIRKLIMEIKTSDRFTCTTQLASKGPVDFGLLAEPRLVAQRKREAGAPPRSAAVEIKTVG